MKKHTIYIISAFITMALILFIIIGVALGKKEASPDVLTFFGSKTLYGDEYTQKVPTGESDTYFINYTIDVGDYTVSRLYFEASSYTIKVMEGVEWVPITLRQGINVETFDLGLIDLNGLDSAWIKLVKVDYIDNYTREYVGTFEIKDNNKITYGGLK